MSDFTLFSLRGGLNDFDPPTALPSDACTVAENVEFFYSTLGERRLGCTAVSLPASITADPNMTAVVWMYRHLPTASESGAQLWVLAQNLAGAQYVLTYRDATTWNTVTPSIDTINVAIPNGHRFSAQTLHGKLFFAFDSDQDILHVWDGTRLRRVGLTTPAAPTAANSGVGTFAGTRYYRIRYTVMSGATVSYRSEPGAVLTFAPSGTGASAVITKPVSVGENETHWEIEASTDNANFYRLSQIIVGTTTYTDSVALGTGYSSTGTLSEDVTAYTRIPSGKFLVADEDRLIIGGSWENTAYGSRVWWTPVYGSTGAGNDERVDLTTDPFLDLDGFSGGELTGLSRSVNGYIFAFKWGHIYKIVRKGQRSQAYEAFPLTKAKGALPGSIVEAFDESGNPSLYFLEPKTGPHRIGSNGIEHCGQDVLSTWQTVNLTATVPCHGVFYPDKHQVHWWIATDGASYPNKKIILQINETRSSDEGARRGWTTVPSPNRIAAAHCSTMFSSNIDSLVARNQTLVPFIGKEQWTVSGTVKDLVQRCDTGNTDAHTSGDTVSAYTAKVRSKPFLVSGLLTRHGIQAGTLLAESDTTSADQVYVKLIRDFGVDSTTVNTNLAPGTTEEHVIKQLDNLTLSECKALQIEFGDTTTPTNPWRLNGVALKVRKEDTQ
jgi:hypothetical protein